MKLIVSLLIALVILGASNALPTYGQPLILDMRVTTFTVDPTRDLIFIASNTSVLVIHSNGTVVNNLFVSPKHLVQSIATSPKTGYIATLVHDKIQIYEPTGIVIHEIKVGKDYYGLWFDDVNDAIVTIKYVYNQNASIYYGEIKYYNYTGHLITEYGVEIYIGDLIVNPNNGDLIFNNIQLGNPTYLVTIANMTNVIAQANVTKWTPNNGLAVNANNTIISSGYGIDLFNYNGTLLKHLNCTRYMTFSPQAYQDSTGNYIAYLDMFSNNDQPFIQFIDYDGNKLLSVPYTDHEKHSAEHAYFIFGKNGTIVASIDDQVKIWIQQ